MLEILIAAGAFFLPIWTLWRDKYLEKARFAQTKEGKDRAAKEAIDILVTGGVSRDIAIELHRLLEQAKSHRPPG